MLTRAFSATDIDTVWWEAALRLVLAAVLGAVVGWDREASGRAAGLRTFMMVSVGSAGFTLVGIEFIEALQENPALQSLDPMRVIGAIVGGIGFLGAGAIIQSGGQVRGLTTAAGLWVIAAVGMMVGAGLYVLAGVATGLSVLILAVLRLVEFAAPDGSKDAGGEGPGRDE